MLAIACCLLFAVCRLSLVVCWLVFVVRWLVVRINNGFCDHGQGELNGLDAATELYESRCTNAALGFRDCNLIVARCVLRVACCWMFVVRCLLSVACQALLFVGCCL